MEHTIFATNKERAYEIWGREGKWGQEDQNELLEWKRKTRSFFFGGTRGGTLREAKIGGEFTSCHYVHTSLLDFYMVKF